MDGSPASVLILLGIGLAMGAINNLAGAAGGLGLIGLELAGGLDPSRANASLRLGAVAIGLSGWLGFKTRHQAVPARAWLYGAMTIPGAVAGALAALALPIWVLRAALLVILLAVMYQQLRPQTSTAAPGAGARPWTAPLWFALVGAHMGFLQVGTGLVAITALTALHSRNLVEVNAAKMALVICSSITAVIVMATSGEIVWLPAIALAIGCGIGSFAASRWSVDRGHGAVRVVLLTVTTLILVWVVWELVS